MSEMISCQDLKALMESEELYALFDIREQGEYNERQIYRATSLPRRQIEFRLPDLVSDLNVPIVLYDEGGQRVTLAAATIEQMGYRRVRMLAGGLPAWIAASLPNVSGVNVPSKEFGEHLAHDDSLPEIGPEELHRRIDGGEKLTVIDVRTPEEFGRFCIPGATNIPGGNLILWADALRSEPASSVIINCAGRTRSIVGTATLRRLGLTNVYALKNGTMGWLLAGLELEHNPGRLTPPVTRESCERASFFAQRVAKEENIPLLAVADLIVLQRNLPGEMFYLIDVRSETEYGAGHIAGSLNVPGGQAVQRADDVVAVRNARIIFVSNRADRATMAAYWYARMGFSRVAILQGGLKAWQEAGQETKAGLPRRVPFGYERACQAAEFIAATELQRLLSLGQITVLDVSTSLEFQSARVPSARWLSRGWLELKFPALFPDRRQAIVVVCPNGHHSVLAARTLMELGYTKVSVLEGGFQSWKDQNLPLESGFDGCLMPPNDLVLSPSIKGDREAMKRYLDWEINLRKE
jgi:rhodanese-related sulfurtransferase